LSAADRKAIDVTGRVLPFKANNYITGELIDWGNVPEDPIFTLFFPRREMLNNEHFSKVEQLISGGANEAQIKETVNAIRLSLNPHPAEQSLNVPTIGKVKLNGMQHKYHETVLFFPTQGQTCHGYCTFCFRWPQFSGMKGMKFAMKETDLLVKYLKAHREATDLLFTGGDPLTMSASRIAEYVDALFDDDLEHIQTIRFGTKALASWPYRFLTDNDSDDLMRVFEKIVKKGKNLAIMAHFNHPVELSTNAAQKAISRVLSVGAQIRTQSPVFNHINNSPELWAEMWQKQVNLKCIPYYMFIARDTGAREFFELSLIECWDIFRKAYQKVSGICRTVRGPSMSTTPGKVQVEGVGEINGEKVFVLRFLQGRNPDWVARPFFAKYDDKATWLSDLQPAFGEEKFFFEKK
jgi:L-lysine 2,3-aminomutase